MLERNNKNNLEILLKSYRSDTVTIEIRNPDCNFTEKIINENIQIQNLYYSLTLEKFENIESVIKSKYIPKYVKTENIKKQSINFSFEDLEVDLSGIERHYLYGLKVDLVERIHPNDSDNSFSQNSFQVNTHKTSNHLLWNNKYGLINEERITQLNKEKFGRKIVCASEKDAIKNVNNEIQLDQLENLLSIDDIKSLTLENRNYKGIDKFVNSNSKFSRKMTEDRQKKILYGTNTQLFFEDKMIKNKIKLDKNPFMKNEWFMGGIYSYDNNYKKYI